MKGEREKVIESINLLLIRMNDNARLTSFEVANGFYCDQLLPSTLSHPAPLPSASSEQIPEENTRNVYNQKGVLPEVCTTRSVYYQKYVLPEVCTTRRVYYQKCVLPEVCTSFKGQELETYLKFFNV